MADIIFIVGPLNWYRKSSYNSILELLAIKKQTEYITKNNRHGIAFSRI